MKDIIILAIETSCDETSASVVKNGSEVLSLVISSQIAIHQTYGGVVPEIASREHVKIITKVIDEALAEANIQLGEIDAVAYTSGPGLLGSLLIGTTAAKTLSMALKVPLISVNHMAGHIYANFLGKNKPTFPLVALIISGGHTEFVYMKNHLEFEYLGRTLDDAVGECYDKVGRVIGLPYPAGPLIDKMALNHNSDDFYDLPLPLNDGSLNFSFSGLKSAVINLKNKKKDLDKEKLAASFQKVVIETMVNKVGTLFDLKKEINSFLIAGGVSANRGIREALKDLAKKHEIEFFTPEFIYCTDNAAMIGAVAYEMYLKREFSDLKAEVSSSKNLV